VLNGLGECFGRTLEREGLGSFPGGDAESPAERAVGAQLGQRDSQGSDVALWDYEAGYIILDQATGGRAHGVRGKNWKSAHHRLVRYEAPSLSDERG
jgi:hypothetical protein